MAGMAEVVRGAHLMRGILQEARTAAKAEDQRYLGSILTPQALQLIRLNAGFTATLAREAKTFSYADGIEAVLGKGRVYAQTPEGIYVSLAQLRAGAGKRVEEYLTSGRARKVDIRGLLDQPNHHQVNVAYVAEGTSECGSKQQRVCDDAHPKKEDACKPSACGYANNACQQYQRCLGLGGEESCTPKHLKQGVPYAAGLEGATARVVAARASEAATHLRRQTDEGYRHGMRDRLAGVSTRLERAGTALLHVYDLLQEVKVR